MLRDLNSSIPAISRSTVGVTLEIAPDRGASQFDGWPDTTDWSGHCAAARSVQRVAPYWASVARPVGTAMWPDRYSLHFNAQSRGTQMICSPISQVPRIELLRVRGSV